MANRVARILIDACVDRRSPARSEGGRHQGDGRAADPRTERAPTTTPAPASESERAAAQLAALTGRGAPPATSRAPSPAETPKATEAAKPAPPPSAAPGSIEQDDARARDLTRQRSAGPETARIAPGDRLAIRVEHMDEVSGTVEVGSDGQIELPLLGRVPAAGRNQRELVADLTQRLTIYLQAPQVDVVSQRGAEQRQ